MAVVFSIHNSCKHLIALHRDQCSKIRVTMNVVMEMTTRLWDVRAQYSIAVSARSHVITKQQVDPLDRGVIMTP